MTRRVVTDTFLKSFPVVAPMSGVVPRGDWCPELRKDLKPESDIHLIRFHTGEGHRISWYAVLSWHRRIMKNPHLLQWHLSLLLGLRCHNLCARSHTSHPSLRGFRGDWPRWKLQVCPKSWLQKFIEIPYALHVMSRLNGLVLGSMVLTMVVVPLALQLLVQWSRWRCKSTRNSSDGLFQSRASMPLFSSSLFSIQTLRLCMKEPWLQRFDPSSGREIEIASNSTAYIRNIGVQNIQKTTNIVTNVGAPQCERCSMAMVKRRNGSDKSQFWGCLNFFSQKCRFTKNIC